MQFSRSLYFPTSFIICVFKMRSSEETRQTIIKLHNSKKSCQTIVNLLSNSISLSAVYKIIKKYKQTGSIAYLKKNRGRKFSEAMKNIVRDIYAKTR